MKLVFRLLLMGIIMGVILWLAGCTEETTSPAKETPAAAPVKEIITIKPKGTISGKIFDRCTGLAINGAVMSVGYDTIVHSTVSDASGSFAFPDVPAGQYSTTCATCTVWTGTYLVTASLVNYNAQQADTSKRYREYYYFPVTITFTSLVPGDSLGVSGLVGSVACSLSTLSTILKGTVVYEDISPAPNASVTILDHLTSVVVKQVVTGVDGSFQVAGLENGGFFEIYAKSADGSLEGMTLRSFPCNYPSDSLRTQDTLEQIILSPIDNFAPYVTDITPEDASDVSTSVSFVYTFSEPIQQNSYTLTTLGVGHGTIVDDINIVYNGLKKTQAPLPTPALAWNGTFTTLTITPSGLVGSAKYTLNAATAMGKLKDRTGIALVANPYKAIIGDNEALDFTTAGGTAGPTPPTNFARRTIQGILGPLDYTGGLVGLEWNSAAGARSYNLYRSVGNGPFELRHSDIRTLTDIDTISSLTLGGTNPLGSIDVRYQLRAVSADLVEGQPTAITITVSDQVRPQLVSASRTVLPPVGTINYYTYLLLFSEPIPKDSAQGIWNYVFQNTDTVTFTRLDVDYLGNNGATPARFGVQLYVSTSNGTPPAGYSLVINRNNIIDLKGNSIDTTTNTYVFSAPPAPVLSTPTDGAVGVSATPTLVWGSANGADTYQVQVSTVPGFGTTVLDRSGVTTTSLGVASGVLSSGVTYYWRVRATNAAGTGSYSTVFSFTVL